MKKGDKVGEGKDVGEDPKAYLSTGSRYRVTSVGHRVLSVTLARPIKLVEHIKTFYIAWLPHHSSLSNLSRLCGSGLGMI